jgi:alpha-tubulin suppressor-like RCC1 family protein
MALLALGCTTPPPDGGPATTVPPGPWAATQISGGYLHTCATTSTGTVRCWGQNSSGQLGDATTTTRTAPVGVVGLSGVTQVSAGVAHTCAVTGTGNVRCWGDNEMGQLGDGTMTNRSTPAAVFGLVGATSVATGSAHSCALRFDQAWCWGHNSSSQLGDGTAENSSFPTSVVGLDADVVAVTANGDHSCALTTVGQVRCWGYNLAGQLGDGTFVDRATPVPVAGLGLGVRAVAAGNRHTCAITSDTRVRCWGLNAGGLLGHGGTEPASSTPVLVQGITGARAISAGGGHTCALLDSGAVRCWGVNLYGAVGDGTTVDRTVPVTVTGLAGTPESLSAGAGHTCAVVAAGTANCWGYNGLGQLGTGSTADATRPTVVTGT